MQVAFKKREVKLVAMRDASNKLDVKFNVGVMIDERLRNSFTGSISTKLIWLPRMHQYLSDLSYCNKACCTLN